MAVVYTHRSLEDNKVFYVGYGLDKSRAYETNGRSLEWSLKAFTKDACGKDIKNYRINIVANNLEPIIAKEIEKTLIAKYGRKDLGKGNLVNKSDGGEGYIPIDRYASYTTMSGKFYNDFKELAFDLQMTYSELERYCKVNEKGDGVIVLIDTKERMQALRSERLERDNTARIDKLKQDITNLVNHLNYNIFLSDKCEIKFSNGRYLALCNKRKNFWYYTDDIMASLKEIEDERHLILARVNELFNVSYYSDIVGYDFDSYKEELYELDCFCDNNTIEHLSTSLEEFKLKEIENERIVKLQIDKKNRAVGILFILLFLLIGGVLYFRPNPLN